MTKIAILPWSHEIEDFLDSVGLSFEQLCDGADYGGWLFGYIESLKRVGIESILVCVSREQIMRSGVHKGTGAKIIFLPSSRFYRAVRRPMTNPYAWSSQAAYGDWSDRSFVRKFVRDRRFDTVPYLATPAWQVAKVLRAQDCQAILCQEYEYPRFDICVGLGWRMRIPVFATFQGGDFQTSGWEKWSRPIAMRRANGFIVGTASERERLRRTYGVPASKIAAIPNPLDTSAWTGLSRHDARTRIGFPATSQVVVWHGRVDIRRKGLDVLLQAWRSVTHARPACDLKLLLVGSGNDNEKLSEMIAGLNLTSVVWVKEYVRDQTRLREYLSCADMYAFPSRHEGFPVAPLEAMACGLPLVAADAQGITDILRGGEQAGGLVVPREDPDSMASALGRLLDDSALRINLGRCARERVRMEFSLNAVGSGLKEFLCAHGLTA